MLAPSVAEVMATCTGAVTFPPPGLKLGVEALVTTPAGATASAQVLAIRIPSIFNAGAEVEPPCRIATVPILAGSATTASLLTSQPVVGSFDGNSEPTKSDATSLAAPSTILYLTTNKYVVFKLKDVVE